MYWFPYSDSVLTRSNDRTDAPPTPRSGMRRYVEEILLVNHGLAAFSRTGRRFPRMIPRLNRTVTRIAGSSDRVDASHGIFVSPRLVRFTEMEYAIPRRYAAQAIRAVRAMIQERRLPISFPIEVRFVAGDDALLSPAHGRDTCYIAVHVFEGMEYETYFRAVEEIMNGFDGRPLGQAPLPDRRDPAPALSGVGSFPGRSCPLRSDGRFTNAELNRVLGRWAGAEPGPSAAGGVAYICSPRRQPVIHPDQLRS